MDSRIKPPRAFRVQKETVILTEAQNAAHNIRHQQRKNYTDMDDSEIDNKSPDFNDIYDTHSKEERGNTLTRSN